LTTSIDPHCGFNALLSSLPHHPSLKSVTIKGTIFASLPREINFGDFKGKIEDLKIEFDSLLAIDVFIDKQMVGPDCTLKRLIISERGCRDASHEFSCEVFMDCLQGLF